MNTLFNRRQFLFRGLRESLTNFIGATLAESRRAEEEADPLERFFGCYDECQPYLSEAAPFLADENVTERFLVLIGQEIEPSARRFSELQTIQCCGKTVANL